MTLDTVHLAVEAGWNLVSLPLQVADNRASSLFPSAKSPAYSYERIYIKQDSLFPGPGYWLKFAAPETVSIIGHRLDEFKINLHRGWNLVGSSEQPLASGELDIDPCNTNIMAPIYGYTSAAGYRQTDTLVPGKAAWLKVNQDGLLYEKKWLKVTDVPLAAISPYPADPSILFGAISSDFSAGTSGAILKSTNWGASWDTILANVDAGYGRILFDWSNPNIIYVGLGSGNTCSPGIIKSTDGGDSWFRADSGIVQHLDCFSGAGVELTDPNNTNILYAAAGGIDIGDQLYKSTDGGTYWSPLTIYHAAANCALDTAVNQSGPLMFAIDPENSNVIYAGTFLDTILYWSTNGGATWSIRHCFRGSGWNISGINRIYVHPTDSNIVFIGARGGFFRSTDRGVSWETLNNGLENLNYGLGLFPTSNPSIFYGEVDTCFYRTSNGGLNWGRVKCDPMITIFQALDEVGNYIYVSNPDGVYRMRVSLQPTK